MHLFYLVANSVPRKLAEEIAENRTVAKREKGKKRSRKHILKMNWTAPGKSRRPQFPLANRSTGLRRNG